MDRIVYASASIGLHTLAVAVILGLGVAGAALAKALGL